MSITIQYINQIITIPLSINITYIICIIIKPSSINKKPSQYVTN